MAIDNIQGTQGTKSPLRHDDSTGFIGNNIDPISSFDNNGSFGLAGTNTSAVSYTALSTDSVIYLNLAGSQTLTLPTASTVNRRIYTIVNPTNISKTISTYTDLSGNTSSVIPANSTIVIQSNNNIWKQDLSSQGLSGNIIAIGQKLLSNSAISWDNLSMRWNGTTDRFEIATISGTANADITTKTNYGIQSTVINGGAGMDGTNQGTPMSLTTTFQVIGDAGILGIEDRVYNIWLSTGQHYRVNAIRKGTTTTDGWATFIVEKIGITTSTIITNMVGATPTVAGASGLVPSPSAGQDTALLLGSGAFGFLPVLGATTTAPVSTPIASSTVTSGTYTQLMQRTGVPAGTYMVWFTQPTLNTATTTAGINCEFGVGINGVNPIFSSKCVAHAQVPATGWTASYGFGVSGFDIVTLAATGTIEVKVACFFAGISAGNLQTSGTAQMRILRIA